MFSVHWMLLSEAVCFFSNLCIDATSETGWLGKLLNHSHSTPNLKALVDIPAGTELTQDYGEENHSVLSDKEWLKK